MAQWLKVFALQEEQDGKFKPQWHLLHLDNNGVLLFQIPKEREKK